MATKTKAKPTPRAKPAPHARPTISQAEADQKITDMNNRLSSHGIPPAVIAEIEALIQFAFKSHVGKDK